jgi:hypothetical protein
MPQIQICGRGDHVLQYDYMFHITHFYEIFWLHYKTVLQHSMLQCVGTQSKVHSLLHIGMFLVYLTKTKQSARKH